MSQRKIGRTELAILLLAVQACVLGTAPAGAQTIEFLACGPGPQGCDPQLTPSNPGPETVVIFTGRRPEESHIGRGVAELYGCQTDGCGRLLWNGFYPLQQVVVIDPGQERPVVTNVVVISQPWTGDPNAVVPIQPGTRLRNLSIVSCSCLPCWAGRDENSCVYRGEAY